MQFVLKFKRCEKEEPFACPRANTNPLLPGFFFRRFTGQPKIGSFRLLTLSHAHMKFFDDPFLF